MYKLAAASSIKAALPKVSMMGVLTPKITMSEYPVSIRASQTEALKGRLSPQNLQIAIRNLHHDGLIVVENVIDHSKLDALNEVMVRDAFALQAKKENIPFNYNKGNIQQDAPPIRKHFDTQIFMSKWQDAATCSRLAIDIRRFNHDTDHIDVSGASTEMDILLCEYRIASNSRDTSSVSTSSFRCRF
jgi:hypothetical protein